MHKNEDLKKVQQKALIEFHLNQLKLNIKHIQAGRYQKLSNVEIVNSNIQHLDDALSNYFKNENKDA
jgi:hypothetical protein